MDTVSDEVDLRCDTRGCEDARYEGIQGVQFSYRYPQNERSEVVERLDRREFSCLDGQ